MSKTVASIFVVLLAACLLTNCQSDATNERRAKAEAGRQVAEDEQDRADSQANQSALTALALAKQHDLDGIEQRRTGDVYAHSCRKAMAFSPGLPVSVDTKSCSSEQLTREQEAERRQMFEDAMKNNKGN